MNKLEPIHLQDPSLRVYDSNFLGAEKQIQNSTIKWMAQGYIENVRAGDMIQEILLELLYQVLPCW